MHWQGDQESGHARRADLSAAGLAAMAALLGAGAFASALASQYFLGLEPCPLCVFQRVAMIATSLIGAAGAAAGFKGWRKATIALLGLALVCALVGLGISGRHMYVMWVPQEASCGPDLDYLMASFPPSKWLPKVFSGEAECAAAAGHLLLGLPVPVWAALVFCAQSACFGLGLRRANWPRTKSRNKR